MLRRRYELLTEIGRGGCAVVFEALDRRLDRIVAIKLPLATGSETARIGRFAREARVIASLHHPNVCAVLDTGVAEEGTPFLVMERLYGESLRASITRARLGVHEALAVGLQLLSALDAVHRAGIVHRDIKPDNVILVARGGCDPIVKLLDFGLCRRSVRRRWEEETMTCEGAIVGTPEYMAPEQVLGSVSLDVRVDLYAVGLVLYESLTGERAFFSKDLQRILSGVITKQVPSLRQARPDVPASLERVVAHAMAKDPARRYPSAADFQADLLRVKRELAATRRSPPRRRRQHSISDEPTREFVRPRAPSVSCSPDSMTAIATH